MIIKIPVSPLSKKILIAEYPSHEASSYIIANSHSLLYRQIAADLPLRYSKRSPLTTHIYVDAHIKGAKDEASLTMVGLMIHQEHKDAVSRWIQATVASGDTASHGIRTFMDHYDLDEDDLPVDTTLRTWQRYVRKHVDLISRPKEKILMPKVITKKKEITFDDDTFAHFIASIVEYIYDRDQRWNRRIVRNLQTYIISQNNQLTAYQSADPIKALYSQVISARKWIHKYPFVKEMYHKYYADIAASSQHDTKHRVNKVTV
jgi:hypothetical protein